jgi:hypothetical protein
MMMKDGVLDFEKAIEIQARVELGIQDSALREAQKGDWSLLAGHIRHGGRITPQMRPFLADVLDGKRKRPNKKISKGRTESRNVMLLSYVAQARRHGEKDWLAKAEEIFRLSGRHIQKILKNEREGSNEKLVLAEPEKFEEQISSFLGTEFKDSPFQRAGRGADYRRTAQPPSLYESAAREVARVRQGGVVKYALSATALAPYVGFPTRETVKWEDLPKDHPEDQPSQPL